MFLEEAYFNVCVVSLMLLCMMLKKRETETSSVIFDRLGQIRSYEQVFTLFSTQLH
jgi:hypothetical protein